MSDYSGHYPGTSNPDWTWRPYQPPHEPVVPYLPHSLPVYYPPTQTIIYRTGLSEEEIRKIIREELKKILSELEL